ncbi:MAG: hypothetical protein WD030_09045 [Pirellulales bacterium]
MKVYAIVCAVVALSLVVFFWLGSEFSSVVQAAEPKSSSIEPEAVEDDMHEFMEYVFQPTYNRLKQSMSAEPTDNAAWKGIKSDALILAEGGNLLLFRSPDEEAAAWAEHSTAVRELGGKLYQAAKKKDYTAASEEYKTMLMKCNACHNAFADGKHQLSP